MQQIKIGKPQTEAQRETETTQDTWEVTTDILRQLKLPPFQRELKVNTKVTDLATKMASEITNTGSTVISGVFCVGLFDGQRWLVDGQHRRHAFYMAEEILKEVDKRSSAVGYVDVRVLHFKTMKEMEEEFRSLNSRLVNMKPDDYLRAMEGGSDVLVKVRTSCPFVGYGMVRRGDKSPMISMAQVMRCWHASANEVPRPGGTSATDIVDVFPRDTTDDLIRYLTCAWKAWGRDVGCHRLWGSLNVSITMWLYRRLVVNPYSVKTTKIEERQFTNCLMSLGSDSGYVDWLVGRNVNPRDMSAAYGKIKSLFIARIEHDTGQRHKLPQPDWGGRA